MKEDKILLANIEDKIDQCSHGYMATYSNFLDMRQRTLVENQCKNVKGLHYQFIGGYPDAERTIVVFLPDYPVEEKPLSIIRVVVNTTACGKQLTHRDYLGSLTALGVKREMIGDILVGPSGCDIVLISDIVTFILYNYEKAGRTNLTLEEIDLKDIAIPQSNFEEKQNTVSSLRLDNVIAATFSVSRSAATDAINQGQVYVNGRQVEKVDKTVEQGDKLVLRGKGKVLLKNVGGTTRKNKISITVDKYL